MANRLTAGKALFGGVEAAQLAVNGGVAIKQIATGTVTIDPANAAAGHEKISTNVTITGVAVGDVVMMEPPDALEDDLMPAGAVVTGANTVAVKMYAGAVVNGASRTWRYLWFDLT